MIKSRFLTTSTVRQRLYEYIRVADEKKVMAIFTIVEDSIEDYEWTKDKVFLAELEKRSADIKSGAVKGIPWEDAKQKIFSSVKTKKK